MALSRRPSRVQAFSEDLHTIHEDGPHELEANPLPQNPTTYGGIELHDFLSRNFASHVTFICTKGRDRSTLTNEQILVGGGRLLNDANKALAHRPVPRLPVGDERSETKPLFTRLNLKFGWSEREFDIWVSLSGTCCCRISID